MGFQLKRVVPKLNTPQSQNVWPEAYHAYHTILYFSCCSSLLLSPSQVSLSFSLPRRNSDPGSLKQVLLPRPHYGTRLQLYRGKTPAFFFPHRLASNCVLPYRDSSTPTHRMERALIEQLQPGVVLSNAVPMENHKQGCGAILQRVRQCGLCFYFVAVGRKLRRVMQSVLTQAYL